MEFSVKLGRIEKQRSACIVVGVFEKHRLSAAALLLDTLSEKYISNILKLGDLEGKPLQTLLLHHVPNITSDRILLINCGKERELKDSEFREIIAKSTATLQQIGIKEAVSCLTDLPVKHRDIQWKIRQAVEVSYESGYCFDAFKSKKTLPIKALKKILVIVKNKRELNLANLAVSEGKAIAEAVEFTKNLGNTPANICTPTYLAEKAEKLTKQHPKISTAILEAKDIKALGMGAFLSVTQGSPMPPKLITLSYKGGKKSDRPIVLVGKGITFDTGGNSLKPAMNMIGMKFDMCGAASVMGVLQAAASLNLPLNIVGVIPSCENIPGGHASRPDDIVTSMSGLTIEIANTDAEGRLILCDALTYCERFDPEVVIDIATLTGAVVVALGRHASGLMGNHPALVQDLLNAGTQSSDRAWQLPIWDDYQNQLKSPYADLCNIGGPEGGSITAGCFLANFTQKYHWAHLDVAGTAFQATGDKKGATGRPVPLLVQYLIDKSQVKK